MWQVIGQWWLDFNLNLFCIKSAYWYHNGDLLLYCCVGENDWSPDWQNNE